MCTLFEHEPGGSTVSGFRNYVLHTKLLEIGREITSSQGHMIYIARDMLKLSRERWDYDSELLDNFRPMSIQLMWNDDKLQTHPEENWQFSLPTLYDSHQRCLPLHVPTPMHGEGESV